MDTGVHLHCMRTPCSPSHLFLGECRGGCKAARGAVGVKNIPGEGVWTGGGHCCQWFWMQMMHRHHVMQCNILSATHCDSGIECNARRALEIMHFSTRNCIIHPIYDGQPTVQCSFGPSVGPNPHSCCKSFKFYFHTQAEAVLLYLFFILYFLYLM